MIKKILFTALLLTLAYSAYVSFLAPSWWYASQHQWQDNVIKAQQYLYQDEDSIRCVILGSSLSNRLVPDSLPHTYNLSFSGQGIHDGLRILTSAKHAPETVFIETNMILVAENKDFTETLFSPFLYYPKKVIPALRDDRQPIAVAGKMCMQAVENVKGRKSTKPEPTNEALFEKMLEGKRLEFSVEPDSTKCLALFNTLQNTVAQLESKGVHVVFFEMPIHASLQDAPKAKTIRNYWYRFFPPGKYDYIPLPTGLNFKTTDGTHLSNQEALQYTSYFRQFNSKLYN